MANGQYRILEAQLPLIGGAAGHNFIVLIGPNGELIGELHGMARDADGNAKSIGNMPDDRLKSTESPGDIEKYFRRPFYRSHYAQEELASGDQATIMNLWNAARAAGARMDERDIQYPWNGLGQNSNSFASTLIAAMGLTEPSMSRGAPIMPGARSVLLEPKAIQEIQRQFNIGAPRSEDSPNATPPPDGSDQPSRLDTARWPFGPVGAPGSPAQQAPNPSTAATPRRDFPGTAVTGAQGPTSVGGPNGPSPLVPPANSRSPAPASSAGPAVDPTLSPLHFAPETPQNFGPFEMPRLFRSDVFGDSSAAPGADGAATNTSPLPTPAFDAAGVSALTGSPAAPGIARPPSTGNAVWDWWNGLAADVDAISRRTGLGGLNISMPNEVPAPPTQTVFDRGLPGMLQRAGAFDPPAGGLLGMLQEHMRYHPDNDDASA